MNTLNKKIAEKLKLYLVTDRPLSKGRDIEWIVEEAIEGGVTIVQLREKNCSTGEFVELALRVKKILSKYDVPLIINDRIDIALACDADGVHIGQSDMPYKIARKILGSNKIIGLSVENIEQAELANNMDVDYIAVSPVYLTKTKTDTAKELGLQGVRDISALSNHPVVGIGGMNKNTIGDVIKSGAGGVAVVSAIVSDNSPKLAAKELINIINSKGI